MTDLELSGRVLPALPDGGSPVSHILADGVLYLRCQKCRHRPVPHGAFITLCDPCLDDAIEKAGEADPMTLEQSMTACCPRQTIPDSCSCLEDCTCMCLDCICGAWGEEYDDD